MNRSAIVVLLSICLLECLQACPTARGQALSADPRADIDWIVLRLGDHTHVSSVFSFTETFVLPDARVESLKTAIAHEGPGSIDLARLEELSNRLPLAEKTKIDKDTPIDDLVEEGESMTDDPLVSVNGVLQARVHVERGNWEDLESTIQNVDALEISPDAYSGVAALGEMIEIYQRASVASALTQRPDDPSDAIAALVDEIGHEKEGTVDEKIRYTAKLILRGIAMARLIRLFQESCDAHEGSFQYTESEAGLNCLEAMDLAKKMHPLRAMIERSVVTDRYSIANLYDELNSDIQKTQSKTMSANLLGRRFVEEGLDLNGDGYVSVEEAARHRAATASLFPLELEALRTELNVWFQGVTPSELLELEMTIEKQVPAMSFPRPWSLYPADL